MRLNYVEGIDRRHRRRGETHASQTRKATATGSSVTAALLNTKGAELVGSKKCMVSPTLLRIQKTNRYARLKQARGLLR